MNLCEFLLSGHVIPAHPLALTAQRTLDERRQRALSRYYVDAGAGGIAVGVHTTQFEIRNCGLYRPVLELAAQTVRESLIRNPRQFVKIAGLVGRTDQAVREAQTALDLGYDAGLLSLGAWKSESEQSITVHCKAIAEVIPLFGFYLQPAVGGRVLSYRFWREFVENSNVVAIKVAAFNRYQTIDVVRALADSGRSDIALYTGNDDNILLDLLCPYRFGPRENERVLRFVGGLLGQWAVWTDSAVRMLERVKKLRRDQSESRESGVPEALLAEAIQLTDANGAIFDVENNFSGCIAGIHEVLRRQGLLTGIWCLNAQEGLSRGQSAEIDRVLRAYPHLTDDGFVSSRLQTWLS